MADFLNKIVSGINKGAETVSKTSKVAVEKTKLNAENYSLENEIKEIEKLLGEKLYGMYCDHAEIHPDLLNFCCEIESRKEKINKNKNRLNVLSAASYHENFDESNAIMCACGQFNSRESKFCIKCGKELTADSTAEN